MSHFHHILKGVLSQSSGAVLELGQEYQGGIIAYFFVAGDEGFIAGEQHGVICAKSNDLFSTQWGCTGLNVTGHAGTKLSGKGDTDIAIAAHNTWQDPWYGETNGLPVFCDVLNNGQVACKIVKENTLNGYSDWYISSRIFVSEVIYPDIHLTGIHSYGAININGSDQRDANRARGFAFSIGANVDPQKHLSRDVIPCRNF